MYILFIFIVLFHLQSIWFSYNEHFSQMINAPRYLKWHKYCHSSNKKCVNVKGFGRLQCRCPPDGGRLGLVGARMRVRVRVPWVDPI